MAESEFQEGNYDDRGKMRENTNKELEELLEKMEERTVQVAWVIYSCTAFRTNPDLLNATQHLEDAFLRCREQIEKRWQEVLME
ncbi:SYCE3 protein, partial [Oreocharis arfaki]|nr:SYCE3 protein [Oreocharis arfaki]